ncbi:MAG: MFS transporter [Maricaulis sp.]|uniref:spinster family MFS transporter n=1 Tax=Maricaulis sp. TaxID=1486257 RepID=UPI001B1331D7|nr:MFS transporter [Maricaulis sp.]MBO6729100.1 MFS transporter [Maricaulis sp.]MBO6848365.1 MFS transporter [Maricaulis sp.]MBO6878609.1 MFS transporter [Maricaulis sp.]
MAKVDNGNEQAAPSGAPAGIEPLAEGPRKYALGLLLLIYVLNFLDRQVVNILAEPIKVELGLADWQLGALTGLAFALFYTVLGLPIARLAERADRVKIISIAVGVWSAFTVACGMAGNFVQLLLARIGVGVGEAGCTPPAHSLISDYTPAEKRTSAIAFYSMGIPLGSLAGMALGGMIADSYGWRVAFFVAGAPGILLALAAWFTLPEPRRNAAPVEAKDHPSLMDATEELLLKPAFLWISLAAAINAMVSYGHIAFYGSFYARNHTEGLAAMAQGVNDMLGTQMGVLGFLGLALGILIGIFGAIGTFAGGQIADRWVAKDKRAYAYLPAIAGAASFLPFLLAMMSGSVVISLMALAIVTLLGSVWYGPIFACAQSLVKPRTRATASAVILFVINLIGLGLGPLAAGIISDSFATQHGVAEGLRYSLITVGAIGLLALPCFWLASRTLADDIEG